MIIGWDLDGVLYSWHEVVLDDARLNKIVPQDYTLEQFFGPGGFFNEIANDLFRQNTLKIPTFYEKAFISMRNKKLLDELSKNNILFYITSRPEEADLPTRKWVERNKLPYPDNLFILQDGKRDLVQKLGIQLFIDDRPKVADELKDVTRLLLYNRPWNRDYNDERVTRIFDLEEIKQWVQ